VLALLESGRTPRRDRDYTLSHHPAHRARRRGAYNAGGHNTRTRSWRAPRKGCSRSRGARALGSRDGRPTSNGRRARAFFPRRPCAGRGRDRRRDPRDGRPARSRDCRSSRRRRARSRYRSPRSGDVTIGPRDRVRDRPRDRAEALENLARRAEPFTETGTAVPPPPRPVPRAGCSGARPAVPRLWPPPVTRRRDPCTAVVEDAERISTHAALHGSVSSPLRSVSPRGDPVNLCAFFFLLIFAQPMQLGRRLRAARAEASVACSPAALGRAGPALRPLTLAPARGSIPTITAGRGKVGRLAT